MPTNLAIDDKLITECKRVGRHRTKRETVEAALREYLDYRKRLKAIEGFGTIDFDPDWDYKKLRRMR